MLKTGDKVFFLNDEGNGVIIKKLENGEYLILNDLGFEVAYPENLIRLINLNLKEEKTLISNKDFRKGNIVEALLNNTFIAENQDLPTNVKKLSSENEGLIAGITFDEDISNKATKWTLFIYNVSECRYFYTARSKSSSIYSTLDYGTIESGEVLYINTFDSFDITNLKEIIVQAIVVDLSANKLFDPINNIFKIKPQKLYNKSLFTNWAELGKRALVLKSDANSTSSSHIAKANSASKEETLRPMPTISNQYIIEKEVDLHIEKLYPNHNSLSSHEKFEMQISVVKQNMDDAIMNNYKKITFIHGVGNGKLREHTCKIIAGYMGVKIVEGNYGRYGFGATTVFFENNY